MRKLITLLICLNMYIFVFSQQKTKQLRFYYEIEFEFIGKMDSYGDSLFALKYCFSKVDFLKLKKFCLEDSQLKKEILLKDKKPMMNAEIKTDKNKTYLVIINYNRYDLPIPMDGEDNSGNKVELNHRMKNGQVQTSTDIKAKQRLIRETLNQTKTKLSN